jgi:hypothetical protein
MQFLDGGASGSNGRDSRTPRSFEQDPADEGPTSGRGSLMARYRGTPEPAPEPEDSSPSGERPGGGAPGGSPAGGESPWRQSGWTSAPPVLPAPSAPATPPSPPTSPASTAPPASPPSGSPSSAAFSAPASSPSSTAPASTARPSSSAAPASTAPAAETAAPTTPAVQRKAGEPTDEPADESAETPADTPARDADTPADRPAREVVRTPADTPADVAPAAAPTEPAGRATPAASTNAHGLLSAERSAEFKRRWRDLQADFVDDPQQAVREAGDLSREILRALSDTIADADQVDRWQAEDGTSGTEDLRIALRQYRALVDRLLEL